tara:strand:+ start:358 stop:933 length:576 start_codon:yes stop_codon:yes gene_type:complete
MKNLLLIVMMGVSLVTHSQSKERKYINNVISSAIWQTTQDVTYDGSYREIQYPMGDVPPHIGVCTDVIIRAYRQGGIDLQVLVHESVKKHHKYYYPNPFKGYGLHPDSNIDHRRVRILKKFLRLHYPDTELSYNDSYLPGDIIFWDNWHVGILINEKVPGTNRYYCVHNIGMGPVKGDVHYYENKLEHFRF